MDLLFWAREWEQARMYGKPHFGPNHVPSSRKGLQSGLTPCKIVFFCPIKVLNNEFLVGPPPFDPPSHGKRTSKNHTPPFVGLALWVDLPKAMELCRKNFHPGPCGPTNRAR